MFHEILLSSWQDFESWLADLAVPASKPHGQNNTLLFRGQKSCEWPVQDTLYRRIGRTSSIVEYYAYVKTVRHPLETFMQQTWAMPEWPSIADEFAGYDRGSRRLDVGLPGYDCLLFLRHHGFPSPLLDWSRSPYVAAFFAYCQTFTDEDPSPAICILKDESTMKVHSASERTIYRTGEYVSAHPRHQLQQCDYTFCASYNLNENFWRFDSHETYFRSAENRYYDLFKVTLPKTERERVLKTLDRYNLNAYSLFGSLESLLETLAFRVFEGSKPTSQPLRPRKWSDI
jgi:hypothetical protein